MTPLWPFGGYEQTHCGQPQERTSEAGGLGEGALP